MPPDELKVAIIVATTGNGHLFVEYLFIYCRKQGLAVSNLIF